MSELPPAPSLDEIAENPMLAARLRPKEVQAAVLRCSVVLSALAFSSRGVQQDSVVVAPNNDRLLDAREAAEKLGVPETWVRDMERRGKIASVRLGRYVRFRPEDLNHEVVTRCRGG